MKYLVKNQKPALLQAFFRAIANGDNKRADELRKLLTTEEK